MSCEKYYTNINNLLVAVAALFVAACSSGSDTPPAANTATIDYLPACDALMQENASVNMKDIFSLPVVAPVFVESSLPIGELEAGDFTPINNELGFLLNAINVDITAPADLYIKRIVSTEYLSGDRAGEIDFGMTFEVCSYQLNGNNEVAVAGDFAHMTSINQDITAALADANCVTEFNVAGDTTKCTKEYGYDFNLITAGTLLGGGGGTGITDYKPGFDTNLMDFRFENTFVNRDRVGSDEGPGATYRFGACIYEYFPEPYKTQYLDTVGLPGVPRISETDPCGKLSGIGEAGTAAGIWILEEYSGLDISTDLFDVMQNILVLADHIINPVKQMNISTDLTAVADVNGEAALITINKEDAGDFNIRYKDMLPGTVYCLEGSSSVGGGNTDFYYYLELVDAGATLKLERLDDTCSAINQAARVVSDSAMRFVR